MHKSYPGLAAGVFILLSRGHLKQSRYLEVIAVTKLNGTKFVLNAEMIRYIESTPDTMITLLNGERLMVQETLEDVVHLAIEYCRKIRIFGV